MYQLNQNHINCNSTPFRIWMLVCYIIEILSLTRYLHYKKKDMVMWCLVRAVPHLTKQWWIWWNDFCEPNFKLTSLYTGFLAVHSLVGYRLQITVTSLSGVLKSIFYFSFNDFTFIFNDKYCNGFISVNKILFLLFWCFGWSRPKHVCITAWHWISLG